MKRELELMKEIGDELQSLGKGIRERIDALEAETYVPFPSETTFGTASPVSQGISEHAYESDALKRRAEEREKNAAEKLAQDERDSFVEGNALPPEITGDYDLRAYTGCGGETLRKIAVSQRAMIRRLSRLVNRQNRELKRLAGMSYAGMPKLQSKIDRQKNELCRAYAAGAGRGAAGRG